jgi:hypothetical protein
MEHSSLAQLDLFDPDADLSAIGITRQQLEQWHRQDLISFDPHTPTLERWMLQETVFIQHLTKVEWSVNALRKLLEPLNRPYLLDHDRQLFNFKEMRWQRRYTARDLFEIAALEAPEEIGGVVRLLVRRLALVGARTEVLKTLAVLREVLPDQWPLEGLPDH